MTRRARRRLHIVGLLLLMWAGNFVVFSAGEDVAAWDTASFSALPPALIALLVWGEGGWS